MNKHVWKYKKLGELLFELNTKNGTKTKYPVYSVTNDMGFCRDYFGKTIASKDRSKYKVVPFGAFAYNPSRINVGSIALQNREDNVIVSPLYVTFQISDDNCLKQDFLMYFMKSSTASAFINANARGAVRNTLSFRSLCELGLNVPSVEEQEAIIAELDEINKVITNLQQQVTDLDTLGKSIFYDMFGDPVTNEKSWKTNKLGELSEIVRGGSPRPISNYLGGDIPWIKIGDATEGDDIYLSKTKEYITSDGLSKTRYIPEGSLIFANCGVSLGFARIIKFKGCIHDGWLAFMNINEKIIDKLFLLKSLNFCTIYFRSIAPDGTQPNLNTSIMKAFHQILPPLSLQQKFAAKVKAIESAKAELNAQITDMQTLLKSRMDYYFD